MLIKNGAISHSFYPLNSKYITEFGRWWGLEKRSFLTVGSRIMDTLNGGWGSRNTWNVLEHRLGRSNESLINLLHDLSSPSKFSWTSERHFRRSSPSLSLPLLGSNTPWYTKKILEIWKWFLYIDLIGTWNIHYQVMQCNARNELPQCEVSLFLDHTMGVCIYSRNFIFSVNYYTSFSNQSLKLNFCRGILLFFETIRNQ